MNMVIVRTMHNRACYYVLHQLTSYAREWYPAIVARIAFRAFLEYLSYISHFPTVRYLASVI